MDTSQNDDLSESVRALDAYGKNGPKGPSQNLICGAINELVTSDQSESAKNLAGYALYTTDHKFFSMTLAIKFSLPLRSAGCDTNFSTLILSCWYCPFMCNKSLQL